MEEGKAREDGVRHEAPNGREGRRGGNVGNACSCDGVLAKESIRTKGCRETWK